MVVIFSFQGFSVLTLGDLGEVGQKRLLRQSWPYLSELRAQPLLLKVAHHGSKDQSPQLHELIEPDVGLVSVGQGNDYGHPNAKTMNLLFGLGATILRTDTQGAIAIRVEHGRLVASTGGKLSL